MANGHGPTYISSHSADVILSDIRPIKLQPDALRCINVLLDEFLYNILGSARSLATDKLRAGLLKVLPTSLGKDALLEAEVELRAYWDRTGTLAADIVQAGDDQGKNFSLQWAFELLRLKCEAYSTLNETDEDPDAETRLQMRMSSGGGLTPPKSAQVAPASLYLTAMLESVCEHILSNVGRVAARDSSRTSATVQDLFVALCEDDSIYGLFKSMKIYEQVESLSKASKPRRSKSSSRLGDNSGTSSPRPEFRDSTSRRTSSESAASTAAPTGVVSVMSNPRSSLDKTKASKMFNRASTDRDGGYTENQRSHRKSASILSDDNTRRSNHDVGGKSHENAAMLQEFDNLMRSDATMKVSLTPDRLKSMDVYNKEKNLRSNRQPLKPDTRAELDAPPRALGRRPSLRHVDSIIEDEEESTPSKAVTNKTRPSTASSVESRSPARMRSSSASHPPSATSPSLRNNTSSTPVSSIRRRPVPYDLDTTPTSNRNQRVVQDDADLDEEAPESTTPSRRRTPFAVSSNTRDLIDFLSEGPPDDPPTMASQSAISLDNGKSKGSGRLQKMMSKLSIGGSSEKLQSRAVNGNGDEAWKKSSRQTISTPPTPSRSVRSTVGVIPANRPIPPPPPRPPQVSPLSSSQESLPEPPPSQPHSPSVPADHPKRRTNPSDVSASDTIQPGLTPHTRETNGDLKGGNRRHGILPDPPGSINEKSNGVVSQPSVEQRSPRKPSVQPAVAEAVGAPQLSMEYAQDMHRLISNATTADECRLILDMFLAKAGMAIDPPEYESTVPLSQLGAAPAVEVELGKVLVEILLDGGSDSLPAWKDADSIPALTNPSSETNEPHSPVAD